MILFALCPAASQIVLAAVVATPFAVVWHLRRRLIARSLHENPPREFFALLRTVDEDDALLVGEDPFVS